MIFTIHGGAMEIWVRGVNDIHYRLLGEEDPGPWQPMAPMKDWRMMSNHAMAVRDQVQAVETLIEQFQGHGVNRLPEEVPILLGALRRLLLLELSHAVHDPDYECCHGAQLVAA